LKDAGLMTPDAWNVSVAKIPTPTGDDLTANQSKVTAITIEDGVITVAVPVPVRYDTGTNYAQKWNHRQG